MKDQTKAVPHFQQLLLVTTYETTKGLDLYMPLFLLWESLKKFLKCGGTLEASPLYSFSHTLGATKVWLVLCRVTKNSLADPYVV